MWVKFSQKIFKNIIWYWKGVKTINSYNKQNLYGLKLIRTNTVLVVYNYNKYTRLIDSSITRALQRIT